MPTPHTHVVLMTHTYILNAVVPEYEPGNGQNACVLSPMIVLTLFAPPGKSVSDLASAVISFKKTSGYFTHSVGISLEPISRNLELLLHSELGVESEVECQFQRSKMSNPNFLVNNDG